MKSPEEFCLGVVTGASLMLIAGLIALLVTEVSTPKADTFDARWPSSKGDKLKTVPYLEYRSDRSQDGYCWPHYECEVT